VKQIQGDSGVGGPGKKIRDGILAMKYRRMVLAETRDICTKRGYSDPRRHPLYDETAAELLLAMVEAHRLADKAGKPWRPYWHTLKRRARQQVWGDDYTAFPVSEWMKRNIVAAKAQAVASFKGRAHSEDEMLERAKTIFVEAVVVPMQRRRREEAWAMVHADQVSLFFPVGEVGDDEPVEFHERLADPNAADPSDVDDPQQLDLITYLIEEADLNSRQRAIAQVLSEEWPRPTNVELARQFGVSKQQVGRDVKRIAAETTIRIGPTKT